MWDHIAKPLNVQVMFGTIAKWIKPAHPQSINVKSVSLSPSSGKTALTNLKGIDVAVGMSTTMDNEDLYRRLLNKFYQGQKDFSDTFIQALNDKDDSAAMRCAHTLKGNAGNIGAKGVQLAAAELEGACKNHASPAQIQEFLAKVALELEPVITSLEAMIGNAVSKKERHIAINPEEFQRKLHLLKSLLEDSDGEAVDCLNDILEQAHSDPIALELKQVMKSIENYDFDQALENLKRVQLH